MTYDGMTILDKKERKISIFEREEAENNKAILTISRSNITDVEFRTIVSKRKRHVGGRVRIVGTFDSNTPEQLTFKLPLGEFKRFHEALMEFL